MLLHKWKTRDLSRCFICGIWLRELDLNQRPSGYEPKHPDFHLSFEYNSLADKPLKSKTIMGDTQLLRTDSEGFQRVGTGQKMHTWVEVALR